MIDRCNPSPCKHSGICKQNAEEFSCDCESTGYSGAVCQTRKNYNSVKTKFIQVLIFFSFNICKYSIVSIFMPSF